MKVSQVNRIYIYISLSVRFSDSLESTYFVTEPLKVPI